MVWQNTKNIRNKPKKIGVKRPEYRRMVNGSKKHKKRSERIPKKIEIKRTEFIRR